MGVTVRYRKSRNKWVVTETSHGKRSQATFATEREARQFAAKAESELNEAIHNGLMGRKPRRTFIEGLTRWVDEYDTKSQTPSILWVAEYMGDDVTMGMEVVEKARGMAKKMKDQGLNQSTINNRVQVVKRVLNLAYREWDWIDEPLGQKLRKPDPKNARHVYLTPEQVLQLALAVPQRYQIEARIITLSPFTGLRKNELLRLEPGNYVDGRIILRPDQTKNGKPRVVPVMEEMKSWLEELPFPTSEPRLRKAFEAAREKAGMKHVRFHDLRHTYASFLAASNAPMTAVRDLLGHSSLLVTSRYSHLFTETLDSTIQSLPKLDLTKLGRDHPATTH